MWTMLPQLHALWSMCSIYFTVGLAFERYSAIMTPTKYRSAVQKQKIRRLLKYLIPIVTASVIFHLPSFFQSTIIGGNVHFAGN